MQYIANADTLFNMAVEALGKYVSQIMKLMIETPSEPRGADLQYHHYQGPCSRLEDLLTHVPTTRAREVTLVLIGHVNRVYTELVAKPNFRDACEDIAPLVLKSVIHPSVKNLECIRYYPHREILDCYKVKNCDLIYKSLPLLKGLKELSLGEAKRSEDMRLEVGGFRDTLEKFSSRSCKDSDIATLANNCKQLKCLDISCSRDITNQIVFSILKFENLEELNLCEVSNLPDEDLVSILDALNKDDILKGIHLHLGGRGDSSTSSGGTLPFGAPMAVTSRSTPEVTSSSVVLSAGVPSTGVPSAGVPSPGVLSAGTPSAGTSSAGISSAGISSAGTSSAGISSAGTPSAGATALPPAPLSRFTFPVSDDPSSPVLGTKMLKFGCSRAGIDHIPLISKFCNLTSLILSDLQSCVLAPLNNLKHLREFALWYSRFFLVENFLKSIGSQLNCLSFTDAAGTDFDLIRRHCSSVKCLHLCFSEAEDLRLPRNWKLPGAGWHPVAAYPSVQSLQIFMSDLAVVEYILTRVRNLRTLFFSDNFNQLFFEGLLERIHNPHLQNLYWGDGVAVTFDGRIASVKKFYSDGVTGVQNIVI